MTTGYQREITPLTSEMREKGRREIEADLGQRYQVKDYLGQGAFATVWKVWDEVEREYLAVKRFEESGKSPRSYYRELMALFRLRHPHLLQIINLLEIRGGRRYLLLEYCRGGSLRHLLYRAEKEKEGVSLARAFAIAYQIALGLEEAHSRGLAHRDLKPENILFGHSPEESEREIVKIADFGTARLLVDQTRETGGVMQGLTGTPAYMAPENFMGSFGPESDIYSLGILLYEMIHGRPPFVGTPGDIARQHLYQSTEIDSQLPEKARQFLCSLLEKEKENRPEARECLAELATLLSVSSKIDFDESASCEGPLWMLPGKALGLLASSSSSGPSFYALTTDGIFAPCQEGFQALYPQREMAGIAFDDESHLWAGGQKGLFSVASHQRGEDSREVTLRGKMRDFAFVTSGKEKAVVILNEDSLFQLHLPQGQLMWEKKFPRVGIRPQMTQFRQREVALTTGPTSSLLWIIDFEGQTKKQFLLPGPAWNLGAWKGTGILYLQILEGNSLLLCGYSPRENSFFELRDSKNILFMASDENQSGLLYGLRPSGEVLRWGPDGKLVGRKKLDLPPLVEFEDFAVSHEELGFVVKGEKRHWFYRVKW